MGTSASYGSPKWPGVTRAIGEAIGTGYPTIDGIKRSVQSFTSGYRDYVSGDSGGVSGSGSGHSAPTGQGGSNLSTARTRAAISGALLGGFLGTAARDGFDAAVRSYDLSEFRDLPLTEFLDSVVDRLAEQGGLLDDMALNDAMARTVDELAQDVATVEEFGLLLSSSNINIEEVLQVYYANILAINFEQKEYSVVRDRISRERTQFFFRQAHDLIKAIVVEELTPERDLSSLDWNAPEGREVADAINREVLEILCPDE